MDPSVAATPLYFASMAVERQVLRRRAERQGPSAADYERSDTLASLGMGLLSLTTPLTLHLVGHALPFRTGSGRRRSGRIGQVLVGVAVGAAAATTVADLVVRRSRRLGDRACKAAGTVSGVGGVVAVAAGGLVLSATSAYLSSPTRLWAAGRRRDLGRGPMAWMVALVGWDLGYYVDHRLMHEVRALWAIHVPHHSSERYNLSTALRQPVSMAFGVRVPYGLMCRFGVRPHFVEMSRALNLIYQFWIHTDTVRSLGPAEAVLNTPSHHRVHHGSNRRYLDRNHAGVLIVWDRLLGTFQREEPVDDPVVYGLTRNIGSHDLRTVSTHEYRAMFADVARSTNWRDRLGYVLRGPGWSPAGTSEPVDAVVRRRDGDPARQRVEERVR